MSAPVNPSFDLDTFLPYRLAVAAGNVSKAFAERYRAVFGLSVVEWRVIANLARGDQVSIRDIFERVDMDKSKVSRAASRLEQAGYIAKLANPNDRRLVALTLTPQGRELAGELLVMALDFQREIDAMLGDAGPGLNAGLDRLMKMDAET